ncbi:hypothetical protein COCSADRAFT_301570 [Bipolaris sorokiniana ND90Pr]|uniref:Uncharacterized protein n=1 Tax=Cochliobolus sativus (strain ND90Pr / ATCC 201652) TaxID=665912 RepID=M2TD96_COCSN|nr:uncharacterized protein COCSADRAFT_301570 [Bipolaris sorokiniana ND90Pr]EMD66722.1 hypothetical protein COCSADRAFT_301570 [Bipolaris sorokiniana ND90Pr]
MNNSKYAPKTPAEKLAESKSEKLKKDKDRITRLLVRLQWKAELLMLSYLRTLDLLQRQNTTFTPSMFQLDFFEFYTLLERYIVSLLSLFHISISSSLAAPEQRQNFNYLRYETNPELRQTRPMADHAFHANLLEALDDPEGPFKKCLGEGEVRVQLGRAKECRNMWKDADCKQGGEGGRVGLQELGVEGMLRGILGGCEEARGVAMEYQGGEGNGAGVTSREFEKIYEAEGMEVEDVPYEYMDDAMDLD